VKRVKKLKIKDKVYPCTGTEALYRSYLRVTKDKKFAKTFHREMIETKAVRIFITVASLFQKLRYTNVTLTLSHESFKHISGFRNIWHP